MFEPENELAQRFPNMRPVSSAPPLTTVNGIGCMLIGSRDHDEETRTYVKTHCFCVLFVPLFSLGAYRVANAPRGWYFIGREPLSGLARAWNWMIVALILGGIGLGFWINHTQSPEYQARKKLAEADRLAGAGDVEKAAQLYREVARGSTPQATPAAGKFKDLLDEPLNGVSLEKGSRVIRLGIEWSNRGDIQTLARKRGLELAQTKGEAEPGQALAMLELLEPAAEKKEEFAREKQALLERLADRHPGDIEVASALAVVWEQKGDVARCEKLLLPHRQKLGTTEAARILGTILARKGKFEEAHALLAPYAEENLKHYREASQAVESAAQDAVNTIIEEARAGHAPDFPYDRYRMADKEGKQAIVNEFIAARLKDHPAIKEAQARLARFSPVVHVALDLGIVYLARARAAADPRARRTELEKAEKTFLAVRGTEGHKTEYNFRLAQVYYWLGKQAEGQKLFKETLDRDKRNTTALLRVSYILREVGAVAEARKLAEEAYNNEIDLKKKQAAAEVRALESLDVEDRVTWLERADPANPEVKASLATARSVLAERKGHDEEAAAHLREAIEVYAGQRETAATLNNAALVYHQLYHLTGNAADLKKSGEMMSRAAALLPDDGIVLLNLVAHLGEAAARDLIGKRIDVDALRSGGQIEYLHYLCRDRKGAEKLVEAVRASPAMERALAQAERLALLAPKRAESYTLLVAVHGFTHNLEALRRLDKLLAEAGLDQADTIRRAAEFYSGKKDEKGRLEHRTDLARLEKRAEKLRKSGGVTFAVAASALAASLMQNDTFKDPVDEDRVVSLAEEAHAAAPSRSTQATVMTALLFRAHRRLVKQAPDYAALSSRGRSLTPSYLLALALGRGGKLREAVLADKDVRRAGDLLRESAEEFPDEPGPWTCVC